MGLRLQMPLRPRRWFHQSCVPFSLFLLGLAAALLPRHGSNYRGPRPRV